MSETELLEQLNAGYVRAAQNSDTRWYDEHLAEDFLASNVDGSIQDKQSFLERIGKPHKVTGMRAVDVQIQRAGDLALIHSRFEYRKPDGSPGTGRYTDIWTRRGERWLCVSAHFNRF